MTDYRSSVDPVDRAHADAAHADTLHNAGPFPPAAGRARIPGATPPPVFTAPDAVRWFGDASLNDARPYSDGEPVNWGNIDTPRAGDFKVEATLIAAAVRCCTPQADDGHEPYCPAYGYPPPVTRDANPITPQDCHACTSVDWFAMSGSVSSINAAREKFHNAGHDGELPPRLLPELDEAIPVPSWAAVAAWAREADKRLYSDIDSSLVCYGDHSNTGHDIGEFYWSDVTDRTQAVQSLVAFIAKHWECPR